MHRSSAASFLGYILPGICFYKVASFPSLKTKTLAMWRRNEETYEPSLVCRLHGTLDMISPAIMIVIGVCAMIIGTVQSFQKAMG